MPKKRPIPQPAPSAAALIKAGMSRERALLAQRVGELRFSQDWNWIELGKKAKVHPKQVEQIELGPRDPQFSTLMKIATAFELHSLDELLGPLPLAP